VRAQGTQQFITPANGQRRATGHFDHVDRPKLRLLDDAALLNRLTLIELPSGDAHRSLVAPRDDAATAGAPRNLHSRHVGVERGGLVELHPQLEEIASQLGGRKIAVTGVESAAAGAPEASAPAEQGDRQAELRQKAMADERVQAMLDVFGTEIKEVEER
jgi:hypothetical protein